MFTIPPEISYAPDGDHVIATQPGNPHRLDWDRVTGDVHLDNSPRPIALRLSEHLFHVEAATLFGRLDTVEHDTAPLPHRPLGLREIPASESFRGAGWMAPCACGHYRTGWCADPAEAGRRMHAHLVDVGAIPRHATSGIEEQPTSDGPRFRFSCSCDIYVTPWCADEIEARRAYGRHLIAAGLIPQQRSATS